MTLALVVANAAVFWLELALGRQLAPFLERWGLVPATLTAIFRGDSDHLGALITPLSAMFMHAGWLHLLGNLVCLWFFGRVVEAALGRATLLGLYLLSGLAAAAAQVAATPGSTVPAVGASGAVAGLLGAYLLLRARPGGAPTPAWGAPLLTALLALWVLTLALGGVLELAQADPIVGPSSWWAHLGGLLAGAILISLYRYTRYAVPGAKRRWLSH